MNALDISNYGLSILVVGGAMGASAALQKYDNRIMGLIESMIPQGEVLHRIVIESDPTKTSPSDMTL